MIYIILIIAIILFIIIVKPYFINYDTVLLFTGGLGSGKSLVSSKMALRLLNKNRLKVWWYNLMPWHKEKKPKPKLYSSIPYRISRKEWAIQATPGHILMTAHIIPMSVLFVDEISLFLDQMTIKFPASDNAEEFATLFRHYTKGGYFVMNTQNSNKVNFHFRYCVNECLNLMHFKKWLPVIFSLFYTVKVRNISLSDDIKKIEEGNKEDNMKTLFGFMPIFLKHYDTYCFSERYRTVPYREEHIYNKMKTCRIMKCPSTKIPAMTTSEDPLEQLSPDELKLKPKKEKKQKKKR